MPKCEYCSHENDERNYYCIWCGRALKQKQCDSEAKWKNRHKYISNIPMPYSDAPTDYFESYKPRKN